MTCLEKYLQDHPGEHAEYVIGTKCPDCQGLMDEPEWCDHNPLGETCTKCWNREIPEDNALADAFIQVGASAVKTGNAIQKMAEAAKDLPPYIKDSGERRQFDTGAVRDIQEGKGRCDLMPLDVVEHVIGCGEDSHVICAIDEFQQDGHFIHLLEALEVFTEMYFHNSVPTMLLEVAKHFEDGAKKYGENNWQKGIPVRCYIDSAVRHCLKWIRGDKDEPHDRAFCWNIICAIWTCKHKPELNDYRQVKNENTCVSCGATIPEGWQYCHTCWENEHGGG